MSVFMSADDSGNGGGAQARGVGACWCGLWGMWKTLPVSLRQAGGQA